jgi:hypothetical protein
MPGSDLRSELTDLVVRVCAAAPSVVAWKNIDQALGGTGDIDLIASASDRQAIEDAARAWIAERTDTLPHVCRHVPGAVVIASKVGGHLVMLDIKFRATWRGGHAITPRAALALSSVGTDGIRRIRPGAEALLTVVLNGIEPGGRMREGRLNPARVAALIGEDPEGLARAARALGPAAGSARRLVEAFARGGWSRAGSMVVQAVLVVRAMLHPWPLLVRVFRTRAQQGCRGLKRELGEDPSDTLFAHWLPRHTDRLPTGGGPRGRVILIAGPDGSGKTSILLGLLSGMLRDVPIKRVHNRDGISILPSRKSVGPASEPHRHPPYPVLVCIAKVFYIWADIVVGWFFRIRPFVRSGGWVIAERVWWDMAVDQHRYRLQRVEWLVRALGRLLPKPDVVLMLQGPPEVIHSRKSELPLPELARQLQAWERGAPAGSWIVPLDVTLPLNEMIAAAENGIGGLGVWPGLSWAGLPSRRATRVWIPRGPRRLAAAGVKIYHPVTPKGRTAWRLARAAARTGVFRLAPPAPPPIILRSLREHLGDATGVAIARATHAQRYVALGLRDDGSATGVVKLALDDRGREALAAEGASLATTARGLTGRVLAPVVRAKGVGSLVLEPVAWLPRRDAWVLPEEVAAALGTLWAGDGDDHTGPGHGDAAPWNLLRTREGWVLIDWERAGNGPAFADVVHYLVQAHAYLGKPSEDQIVAGLRGRGPAGRAVRAFAEAARLEPEGAAAAMLALLREPTHPTEADDPRAPAAREAKARLLARLEREGL